MPLRLRIQAVIDRRDYRWKIDAVRTLEACRTKARKALELDGRAPELVAVHEDPGGPKRTSRWVRQDPDLCPR